MACLPDTSEIILNTRNIRFLAHTVFSLATCINEINIPFFLTGIHGYFQKRNGNFQVCYSMWINDCENHFKSKGVHKAPFTWTFELFAHPSCPMLCPNCKNLIR